MVEFVKQDVERGKKTLEFAKQDVERKEEIVEHRKEFVGKLLLLAKKVISSL